jgi:Leucine-rich repeat (LRR) protein
MLGGSQIAGLLDALQQQQQQHWRAQQQVTDQVVCHDLEASGLAAALEEGLAVSRGVDSCSTSHTATTANTFSSSSTSSRSHLSSSIAASNTQEAAPGTATPGSYSLRSVIVCGRLTEVTAGQLVQLLDGLPCTQHMQYLVLHHGCKDAREFWLPDQDAWAVAGGLPWPPGPIKAALTEAAPVGNSACGTTNAACSSSSGSGGVGRCSTVPAGTGPASGSVSSWRSSLHTVLVRGWDYPWQYMRLLATVLAPVQQLQVLYARQAPVLGLCRLAPSLRSLRVLHVDCNSVEGADMMEAAAQLTGLRRLRIKLFSNNPRMDIPSAFTNMQHLTSLELVATTIRGEGLVVVCSISSLRQLKLSGSTRGPCLPECASRLAKLESLELSGSSVCRLSNISAALTGLQQLVSTTARDTGTMELANVVGSLLNLQHLTISDWQLVSLPDNISQLGCLESLDVSHAGLSNSITALTALRKLAWSDYAGTGAVQLEWVVCLTSLQHLALSDASTDALPDSISLCLESIKLRYTQVVKLPDSMAALTGLRRLVWHSGSDDHALQLDFLVQLSGLQHLAIEDPLHPNPLPATFSQLTQLTELWVCTGYMFEQPCVLSTLVSLERLSVYGRGLDTRQLHEKVRVLASLTHVSMGATPQ